MVGQVVISGLLAGALYAMVALGLGLIFGVMRVLNVAHGPLLMLGAYTTFWLFHWFGLNPYLSLLVSMPVLFLVGVVLQRLLVRRVVDAPELSSLLLMFGVAHRARERRPSSPSPSDLRSVEYLTGLLRAGAVRLLEVARDRLRLRDRSSPPWRSGSSRRRASARPCARCPRAARWPRSAASTSSGSTCSPSASPRRWRPPAARSVAVMVAIQPEMGQVYTFKSFLVIVLGGAGNYPGRAAGRSAPRPRSSSSRRCS